VKSLLLKVLLPVLVCAAFVYGGEDAGEASTLVIGKRLESRLKTEDEPLALDAWDEALRES